MGYSPYFTENDRLIHRFIDGSPRRERGSWRNESTGEEFHFRDGSPASDQAFTGALASYTRTLGEVAKACGITMADVGKRCSTEDKW